MGGKNYWLTNWGKPSSKNTQGKLIREVKSFLKA